MFETFSYWLFLFFVFSVIGWILESIIESVNHRRLLNRGSLWGPYIPIYGVGGILFVLVGIPLKAAFEDQQWLNIFLVFFVGMSLATLLEYWVGSFLERVFKKRYWDYSKLKLTSKFTYKNRVSLVSSLFFGFCSLFQTYFLYERVSAVVLALEFYVILAIVIIMTLAMGIDILVQVRRYERVQEFMQKLSYEQLREKLYNNLLRTAGASQIREFRNAFFENVKNIKEKILPNKEIGHDPLAGIMTPGVPSEKNNDENNEKSA
jgi:uncharacterized membrane protein